MQSLGLLLYELYFHFLQAKYHYYRNHENDLQSRQKTQFLRISLSHDDSSSLHEPPTEKLLLRHYANACSPCVPLPPRSLSMVSYRSQHALCTSLLSWSTPGLLAGLQPDRLSVRLLALTDDSWCPVLKRVRFECGRLKKGKESEVRCRWGGMG